MEASTPTPTCCRPLDLGHTTLRNRVIMGSMHTGSRTAPSTSRSSRPTSPSAPRAASALSVTGGYAPNRHGWLLPFGSHDDEQDSSPTSTGSSPTPCTSTTARSCCRSCTPAATATTRSAWPRRTSPRRSRRSDAEGDDDQGGRPDRRRLRRLRRRWPAAPATTASRSWAPRATSSTRCSPPARTTAPTAGAASAENRMRFPVEIVERVREAVGDDFIVMYRMSLLDLVDDAQSWDETAELARRIEAAGRRSSTPASAGTRPASPPSSRRCRAPRSPGRRRSCKALSSTVPVVASNRINTPEVAEQILADGRGRPHLDGPAVAGRRGVRPARPRRAAPTRSTPASPATRPASTTPSTTSAPAAWSTRAPATRPSSCSCPPARPSASPSSAPARPGSPPPVELADRGHRVELFEAAVRDRRPVPARRCTSPARRSSARRSATTRAGSRSAASSCTSADVPRSPTWPASTTS